jgi:hypothetical protein
LAPRGGGGGGGGGYHDGGTKVDTVPEKSDSVYNTRIIKNPVSLAMLGEM